eukprot:UN13110
MYMDKIRDNNTEPIHLLNELAFIMEHRMKCEYKKEAGINAMNIYWDDHLIPQMHFLLNDEWNAYSLNYVGHIQNMEDSLYKILLEFNDISTDKVSFKDYKQRFFQHERDRHDNKYQQQNDKARHSEKRLKKDHLSVSDLVVEKDELSDELIQLIC